MNDWYKAAAEYRDAIKITPYRVAINQHLHKINDLNETVSELKKLSLSFSKEYISRFVSDRFAEFIVKTVRDTLIKTKHSNPDDIVAVEIPVMDLRFKTPGEIENQLLNKYLLQIGKNLDVTPLNKLTQNGYVTVYRFSIPSMDIEIDKVE